MIVGIMQTEFRTTVTFTASGDNSGDDFTFVEVPGRFAWAKQLQAQLDAAAVSGTSLSSPTCDITIQTTHDPDVAYDANDVRWHNTSFAFAQYTSAASDQIDAIVRGASSFIADRIRIKVDVNTGDSDVATYAGTVHVQLTQ